MSDQGYTLAEIVEIVGLKRRTLQLWAEAGVIRAAPQTERAGTGTHRRFSQSEVAVACLLAPLHEVRASVAVVLRYSHLIRPNVEGGYLQFPDVGIINGDYVTRAARPSLSCLFGSTAKAA